MITAAGGVPAQLRGGSGAAPGAPCRVSTPWQLKGKIVRGVL
jgi:hypothetical protein